MTTVLTLADGPYLFFFSHLKKSLFKLDRNRAISNGQNNY